MPHDVDVDTLIVGAGPARLHAAYRAGCRGRSAAVTDSPPEIGGQVCAMYPEKPIHDVAGLPAVRGRTFTSCPLDALAGFENSTSAEVLAASGGGWIRPPLTSASAPEPCHAAASASTP